MEFLAFEDGTLREERYRIVEGAEEPLSKTKKVYLQQNPPAEKVLNAGQAAPSQEKKLTVFSHSPDEVIFENFTPFEEYTAVVTLTNCTNRSTSFRVLPISPKYRDAVVIKYAPPPKLSAGLSWTVKVIFTPLENVDFETSIGFKTEEGVFFVLLKALKKRSVISFTPETINFGVVIFGEKVTKQLKVRNDGALPAKVFISGSARKFTEVFHTNPSLDCETPVLTIKPVAHQLVVSPFSTCALEITFSPHQDISFDEEIELRYACEEETRMQKISVKGSSGSLPVYVSSDTEVDFKWCFYENTYCERITIANATNISATVVPEFPPYLATSLSFSPETVRVQGNNRFDFFLIFTPQRGLDSTISCDVKMSVSGQTSPIFVKIKACLTDRGFTVEPTRLDFGISSPEEQKLITLKIKNLSDLPQTLGFLQLPPNIQILPQQVVTMVPKEVLELKVGVRPPTLGQYTQLIEIVNEYCDSHTLQVMGHGRRCFLQFSKPCITLPACSVYSQVSCTTLLHNRSSTNRAFHIHSPVNILNASPSAGMIPPGDYIPIVVIFSAPGNSPESLLVEEPVNPVGSKTNKKMKDKELAANLDKRPERDLLDVDELYPNWDESLPDETWSRHKTFFLTCVEDVVAEQNSSLLQVNCTVVKPTFMVKYLSRALPKILTKKTSKRNLRKSPVSSPVSEQETVIEESHFSTCQQLRFGEVALKYFTDRTCVLRYTGEGCVDVQMRPVDTLSPFHVIKPPPSKLDAGEECVIVLRFHPGEYGTYKSTILISALGANDVNLSLLGSCRPANILISLDRDVTDSHAQCIDSLVLDPVQVSQVARQQVFFHNLSSLPIDVNTCFLSMEGKPPHWPENRSLLLDSDILTIPGNSKANATLVFCPQVAEVLRLKLHVSAGAFTHSILVEGRGCERPVYFTFPSDSIEGSNAQIVKISTEINPSFPYPGLSPHYPQQLHFVTEETKTIIVGCVKFGANVECTVTGWSESYLQSGWKLDPMKVNVIPGAHATFTLSYNPKREVGDVSFCTFSFVTKSSLPQAETVCHIRCTGTM